MPVLVVVCEAREPRHGARVVVSDPLNHLPHFLPPLLLFEDPGLLVARHAFPARTQTAAANVSLGMEQRLPKTAC